MIGVFDSGSGGLTVLAAIRRAMPEADILYFGDIKHAPYGLRSQEELSLLTSEAIRFLQSRGATHIVSACNSVSASLAIARPGLAALDDKHLIEMVAPTVASFRGSTSRVLLCATPATSSSNIYQHAFREIGQDIAVLSISELAGAIEFGQSPHEIEQIIKDAFVGCPPFDVLVLGCTHYPLALAAFYKVLGALVSIFDPSFPVARRVKEVFGSQELGRGQTRYCISKDSEPFRALLPLLFPGSEFFVEVLQ